MKVLITGASGFIGSHLTAELVEHGHEVVPVDIRREPLTEDCRREENVERLVLAHRPDRVVHLAARVGRLFGEDDVAETIADNAGMTATIARVCGAFDVSVSYASTSEVYGDCGSGTAYEGMPLNRIPHNAYGLTKRWGEEACRLYAPHLLQLLRFSMPYGPGLPWGRGRAALINFLWQALSGEPIPVHRGAERSWCYIGDTVRAARLVIESGREGAWNVGRDDNALPLAHVARMACDLTGADPALIQVIDPPARQTVVKRLATNKVRALGWAPEVELEEGMWKVLGWIREEMAEEDRELTSA